MSTAPQDYLLPNESLISSTGAGFKGASQSNGLFLDLLLSMKAPSEVQFDIRLLFSVIFKDES